MTHPSKELFPARSGRTTRMMEEVYDHIRLEDAPCVVVVADKSQGWNFLDQWYAFLYDKDPGYGQSYTVSGHLYVATLSEIEADVGWRTLNTSRCTSFGGDHLGNRTFFWDHYALELMMGRMLEEATRFNEEG